MIKNYENKMIKLNADLQGKKKGDTVRVKVDGSGIPVDAYWRRRLKDAEKDGCCEFVGTETKKASEKKK